METDEIHIRIGHSPDPDDAFMFHALTTGAIKTPGRNYEHVLLDIQTLNEKALNLNTKYPPLVSIPSQKLSKTTLYELWCIHGGRLWPDVNW